MARSALDATSYDLPGTFSLFSQIQIFHYGTEIRSVKATLDYISMKKEEAQYRVNAIMMQNINGQ